MVRQLIRSLVEFPIGEVPVFKHHRYSIRRSLHLFLKHLVDALISRVIRPGLIPLHQQLMSLRFCQQGQI